MEKISSVFHSFIHAIVAHNDLAMSITICLLDASLRVCKRDWKDDEEEESADDEKEDDDERRKRNKEL